MLKVLEIINQIGATSSRNEKEAILKANKDNDLLREVLYFVFNPYILTGLSSKKIKKKVSFREFVNHGNFDLMSYLKQNNTGTDVDIYRVQSYIKQQPPELQGLYAQIATKDLKIGIESKTINKIFGKNFIPTFDVMLAEKHSENEKKLDCGFILTEKLDGIRNVIIKENGKISMFSRQGQPVEGLVDIEIETATLPDNYVYDGELLLRNNNNLNSADLYRETVKVVRKDGVKQNVEFYVFDMIPLNEFKNGVSKDGCLDRKTRLKNVLSGLNLTWIKPLEMLYIGTDKEEIARLLTEVEKQGKEGIMANTINGKYECKRSKELLKVKTMSSVDLVVSGFEEGTGKYVGMLGRLNVDYKGFVVGVGSGFSDDDRKYIWENQDRLLNSICEVQYFEESKNQNGGISLRFPVFKGFRFDKTEESYF